MSASVASAVQLLLSSPPHSRTPTVREEPAQEDAVAAARELLQREFSRELPSRVRTRLAQGLPSHQEINELNDRLGAQTHMNYQDFLKSSQHVGHSLRQRFFLASTFDKFAKDREGLIDVEDFLKYVQRSVDVERVELELAAHVSSTKNGVITEQELESFVLASIPRTPLVAGFSPPLHADFLPFYVFTAARRFLFFLDPQRTRSLSIHKLAHSQEMDEFLWLQRLHHYRDDYDTEDDFEQQVAGNWFSAQNAIKLYDQYVRLDEDGDGMLSQVELLNYHGSPRGGTNLNGGGVQLTPAVISRIFQENITYQPAKMDFKTFLDLALALESREHMQSLRYFWRVIDLQKDGLLHPSTVDFFFRDIRQMLLERGYDSCPQVGDVRTEVMDMLGEDDSGHGLVDSPHRNGGHALGPVSFKRMVASGQASTVIAMLIDIHKFWAYDNRESLPAEEDPEEEANELTTTSYYSNNDADIDNPSGANISARTFGIGGGGATPSAVLRPQIRDVDDEDPYDF